MSQLEAEFCDKNDINNIQPQSQSQPKERSPRVSTEITIISPGKLSCPEKAVYEVKNSLLPLYRFIDEDAFASKRIRSFGDLMTAIPEIHDEAAKVYSTASDEEQDISSLDGSSSSDNGMMISVPQRSVLDSLILAEWEDRAEQGLFRYDVTACPTCVLSGSYGFIAQLNEGRLSKKRPTEFCIDQVVQPFDNTKFNFNKALQKEVLFQFEPKGLSSFLTRAAAKKNNINLKRASFEAAAPANGSPNLVLINVSPIEYGHVLLVPRVLDCLPQLVRPDTMLLALQFARETKNPYLRLGFNSLGAYGTINHLHFQAYYLAAPFAIERAPTQPLVIEGMNNKEKCIGVGVGDDGEKDAPKILCLKDYPVRSLVFEAGNSLKQMADVIGSACERLSAANVPYNLFIVDSGARVFLFPNCFAERKARGLIPEDIMATQVDPASFEIAGHVVLKREDDYKVADQEFAWKLLEQASCSEERFQEIVAIAFHGNCLSWQ
jgi:GDP-L-galactose phosphorylase